MSIKINEIAAKMKELFSNEMTRKSFLKTFLAALGILAVSSKSAKKAFAQNTKGINPRTKRTTPATNFDLTAITGNDPAAITRRSVELLGGMGKFIKKGDIVSIKPNMSWNLTPEYAANTNPAVVAAVVKMCIESGAKTVKVFDNTLNDRKSSYENSGIMAAAKAAGAQVFYMDDFRFAPAKFPNKNAVLQDFMLSVDAVNCDVLISVPVAKHHGQAQLSLGMKNLIGLMGKDRGQIHWKLSESICELNEFFKPDLYIIDANAIITAHGPRGGNLSDVVKKNTVAASSDGVLADAYSAKTFFNKEPQSIAYIDLASKRKIGSMNLSAAKIKTERI
ncbi:MAG: DUF362 domain-containing protein [Elusimicrobiota bacterium]|jgi:uncharacterized protein (DUF362 family)|nr:DUF362 domain-containing protein [Elusimicrobiota bacterium]